jgi:hypothetical protein
MYGTDTSRNEALSVDFATTANWTTPSAWQIARPRIPSAIEIAKWKPLVYFFPKPAKSAIRINPQMNPPVTPNSTPGPDEKPA